MITRNHIDLHRVASHLKGKRVLLITTSTRWEGDEEDAKSTALAKKLAEICANDADVQLIDASKLHIYQCEGNVSTLEGNRCGLKESSLGDADKNPTGYHRCWASINHKDDELWRISQALFQSDVVIFFGSVRWGSANSVYQKLIERLNWIENRWTTLEENNVISNIEAGIVFIGHNWNVANVVEHQKQVLSFYGFQVPTVLSGHWQWTSDLTDETAEGYREEPSDFIRIFGLKGMLRIVESFTNWLKQKNKIK